MDLVGWIKKFGPFNFILILFIIGLLFWFASQQKLVPNTVPINETETIRLSQLDDFQQYYCPVGTEYNLENQICEVKPQISIIDIVKHPNTGTADITYIKYLTKVNSTDYVMKDGCSGDEYCPIFFTRSKALLITFLIIVLAGLLYYQQKDGSYIKPKEAYARAWNYLNENKEKYQDLRLTNHFITVKKDGTNIPIEYVIEAIERRNYETSKYHSVRVSSALDGDVLDVLPMSKPLGREDKCPNCGSCSNLKIIDETKFKEYQELFGSGRK